MRDQGIREKTPSLWPHLNAHLDLYVNPLYAGYDDSRHDVLIPSLHPSHIQLWLAYYTRFAPSCQTQQVRGSAVDTHDQKIAQLNQRLRSASVAEVPTPPTSTTPTLAPHQHQPPPPPPTSTTHPLHPLL